MGYDVFSIFLLAMISLLFELRPKSMNWSLIVSGKGKKKEKKKVNFSSSFLQHRHFITLFAWYFTTSIFLLPHPPCPTYPLLSCSFFVLSFSSPSPVSTLSKIFANVFGNHNERERNAVWYVYIIWCLPRAGDITSLWPPAIHVGNSRYVPLVGGCPPCPTTHTLEYEHWGNLVTVEMSRKVLLTWFFWGNGKRGNLRRDWGAVSPALLPACIAGCHQEKVSDWQLWVSFSLFHLFTLLMWCPFVYIRHGWNVSSVY